MIVAYQYCMTHPKNGLLYSGRSLLRCFKMTKNESALLGNLQAGYVGEIIDLCVNFSVHGTFPRALSSLSYFPALRFGL